jgi:hypothetical protein
MRAALARGVPVALLLLGAAHPARPQDLTRKPLRKTDLVRLLSTPTVATGELAAMIRRTCLTFTPTVRDRADLIALGADSSVLREIAACAHRRAPPPTPAGLAPATAGSAPAGTAARAPISLPAPAPAPAHLRSPTSVQLAALVPGTPATAGGASQRPPPVSGIRTGFVLGVGQHATVGTPVPLPLLFEVRDTAGAPLAGQAVSLAVANGRLGATRAVTDSSGRIHVDLILGTSAGPVAVSATVGTMQRQAALYAEPGPVTRLQLRCGNGVVTGRLELASGVPTLVRVTAQDGFGNEARVSGLQAAAGDQRILRVASVDTDSAGGVVRLAPGEAGSTNLVVAASAQREDVSVTVARPRIAGATPCG